MATTHSNSERIGSGVFLTVWKKSPFLQTTKGGYPHITVVYTGKLVPDQELFQMASDCFRFCLTNGHTQIELSHPYVNSFELAPGKMRHDVLFAVLQSDFIEDLRERFIPKNAAFSFQPPHVTHSIHDTLEDAEAELEKVKSRFPMKAAIVGFTI